MSEAERARKKAHAERMLEAKKHYQDCLAVLATFGGPGGHVGYATPEEAAEARKIYKRAHATVWARTAEGRANSRSQDAKKRAIKAIRQRLSAGVNGFYRRMLTEPQKCFYCTRHLPPGKATADHYIPLAKGGEHAASNLVPACADCNGRKRDRWPEEFKLNG